MAHMLSERIFQEFYHLDEVAGAEGGALATAISRLSKTNCLQATIIRCQLARACNTLESVATIPAHAAQGVWELVGNWFGDDKTLKDQFLGDLKDIYSDAMSLWQSLQLVRMRITVAADPPPEDWVQDEDKRDAYGKPQPNSEQPPPSMAIEPLAVLFPQILDDDQGWIFHGFALFHSQPAVLAALGELNTQQGTQIRTAQRRRMSKEVSKDPIEQRSQADRRLSTSSSTTQRKTVFGTSSELSHLGETSSRSSRGRPEPK